MAVDIIARGLAGSAGEQAEIAQRLVAAEYDPTHQYYNTNDIVVYDGKLYLCTDTNVTGTFNPAKWQQIVVSSELTEIINKLATMTNPMLIKGRVDTVNDLPANAEPGWVYFVGAEGSTEFAEYVYTEDDEWQYIGMAQPIDVTLSNNSINPVQNRAITNAIIPIYSSSGTYYTNDVVYYVDASGGKVYKCTISEGGSTSGSFHYMDWTEVSNLTQLIVDNYKAEVGVKNANKGEIFNDYTNNTANAPYSHAEGSHTTAGQNAHAEGYGGTASGVNSHAEGADTVAGGTNSHAQNDGTIANGNAQTALGKYNVADSNSTYAVIIGNGTDDDHRANLLTVDWSGNININGSASTVKFNNSDLFLTSSMVDASLNTMSVRPIQNQAVANALNGKVDTSTFNTAINSKVDYTTFSGAMSSMDEAKYPKAWDVALTMAEYEALPASKYTDGKNYYITDAYPDWEPTIIYGYHVDPDEADPSEAVTYLAGAVGMIPAAMGETAFNYGSWKNAFFMPKPCMVKYDGTVDYYLDENDYAYKANTAETFTTVQGGYNNVVDSVYSIQDDSDANYGFNCRIDNVFPAEKDIRYIVECGDNTLTASVWFLDADDKCLANVTGTMPLKFKSTTTGTAKMVVSFTVDGATAVTPSDVETVKIGIASDIDDASYDGNAMMQWPLIYWKYEAGTADGEGYFYCSNKKVDDTYHCWCNYDANDNITEHFYTSIYNGVILNGKMRSLSGYALTSANGNGGTTGTQEVTAATANNTTSATEWYINTWADWMLIAGLTILMGKSLNVQNTFGQGISSGSQAGKEAYVTGTANNKGLFYGNTNTSTGTTTVVKVFGMENWWACAWRRTAGLVGGANNYLYKLTWGRADGSTTVGYNSTGSGYLTGSTRCTSSNYVKTCVYGKQGFITKTVGSPASSSAYYCDYYYAGTGFALVGGYSGGGATGGFYLGLNAAFSYAYWGIAAALSCKPLA